MTIREAVERSRGHIEKCEPSFGKRVGAWYSELMSKKIPVLIYCSVRTPKSKRNYIAVDAQRQGRKSPTPEEYPHNRSTLT